MERIAVITSGGDSQGMNTCLYNLVKCALINKIEIIGFMRGYQGLIDNDYVKMDFEFVKNVNNLGGSCLKTARSKEFMTDEGKQKVVQNLKALNIDTLICNILGVFFVGTLLFNTINNKKYPDDIIVL